MTELMRRRRALMGVASQGGGLPAEYQQVEYISCGATGDNYIQTDIPIPTQFPIEIEGKFYPTSNGVYNGTAIAIAKPAAGPALTVTVSQNKCSVGWLVLPTEEQYNKTVELKATIESSGYALSAKIDGTNQYSDSASGTVPTLTTSGLKLYLGWRTSNSNMRGRTYFVTGKQNGVKAFEIIPCYRKADFVIGIYDLVSRAFYPATGTWTKGADVT